MNLSEHFPELLDSDDAVAPVQDQAVALLPRSPRRLVELREIQEIRHMADPPWLVEGILAEGAFAALYGKPGVYKSFFALELSFSIATGLTWAGRPVRSGRVIYIAAEGTGGLRR